MTAARSIIAAAACVLACASAPTFAHSGGNGGGSGGGNGGMGAGAGHAGGMSASHMSSKGFSNTNSPIAADRDKGHARAADRASLHSQSHLSKHVKRGEHRALGREV
ncbi:hypothetical protein [Trinickia mobilis]|uniref:hypothetical protein n=1 Tax=Trinickia mobilis TaxID=2816356 RepID=UPI001A8CC334|nr:hypothetical protein [Trinickia mobilis]